MGGLVKHVWSESRRERWAEGRVTRCSGLGLRGSAGDVCIDSSLLDLQWK